MYLRPGRADSPAVVRRRCSDCILSKRFPFAQRCLCSAGAVPRAALPVSAGTFSPARRSPVIFRLRPAGVVPRAAFASMSSFASSRNVSPSHGVTCVRRNIFPTRGVACVRRTVSSPARHSPEMICLRKAGARPPSRGVCPGRKSQRSPPSAHCRLQAPSNRKFSGDARPFYGICGSRKPPRGGTAPARRAGSRAMRAVWDFARAHARRMPSSSRNDVRASSSRFSVFASMLMRPG